MSRTQINKEQILDILFTEDDNYDDIRELNGPLNEVRRKITVYVCVRLHVCCSCRTLALLA